MKNVNRPLLGIVWMTAALAAADPAYVGKWRVNASKSHVTGDTVTIEKTPDGMIQFNGQGFTYKFNTDGKEYPMPDGGSTAWTATSTTVWDVTNRMSGNVTATFHLTLNGDRLNVAGKSTKPDGGAIDFTATYTRVSGGPGFLGTWKSTEVKMPTTTLEITSSGANGVTLKDDTGPLFTAQFDGKDYPAQGKMAGSKNTFAVRKTSDTLFEVTSKVNGKPMSVETYSVSADGKTLTIDGTPTNAKNETYKVVFDRP